MNAATAAWLTRLLVLAHAAGVLGLAAAGVYTYRLHCESFACFAIGLMWMVWAGGQALLLLLGLWARSRSSAGSRWRWLAIAALAAQALTVAVALGAWILK
ncbi:hypothetical protein [Roseateles sp.]|uniref:hypothetical protein n=1 Tax=Roseateles sp. TaxID=1971397 RepID=UPI0039502F4C